MVVGVDFLDIPVCVVSECGVSVRFPVVILDLIQDLFRLRGFGWNWMADWFRHGGHGLGMLKRTQHDGAARHVDAEMLKQVQHDARWRVVGCVAVGCG